MDLISRVVLTDQNIASTKVASYARLNPLLHTADGDGVAKDLHATENALEFAGGHFLNSALLISVLDPE